MKKKAVILLSGGIDSSTSLWIAKAEGFELYALSFDYQQRHRRELKSAQMVAEGAKVKSHLIIKFDMSEIGRSALTSSDIEVPKKPFGSDIKYKNDDTRSSIPVTYVPARNTIFLSFGLAWAENLGAADIFIGANAVDYSGYPDCRPEYLHAFETMANLATKASIEGGIRFKINAPLLHMTKSEIIKKGIELGLDYSLTWSCYDPQPKDKQSLEIFEMIPCSKCDSCLFRSKGFTEAGVIDPLIKIQKI